ncbi:MULTISPECIES: hypothetical protein [Streptomyces]|uniref:DNA recombination protein RmuC n=1 Tax=Streptomyces katrae TaxID=68223 RepID=A0ABT7H2N5_9ACTN|nr:MULTISPECIES: hypothetical protein [Streptomyces]MDK9500167.1 hypothetical protein [Streptomyces katrae]GLX19637.1 hypothetical protein Slala01_32810 [Streptomyces lavendulae subsp. lavendulae]GLX27132.1 hypothetical protein Slala02_29520 [Streptomyces lavendulae subsp. lavendulae]
METVITAVTAALAVLGGGLIGRSAGLKTAGLNGARQARDREPFKAARARLIATARSHLDVL